MQPLSVGSQAPDFSLLNQHGDLIQLHNLQGKRVLIYFYPKAMTPGCTVQAAGLRDSSKELAELNVVVMGISPDPVTRLKKFAERDDLNFMLLSDETHAVADAFGVWGPKQFMGKHYDGIHRHSFLLDEGGKVIHHIDKFKTRDHHLVILNLLNK